MRECLQFYIDGQWVDPSEAKSLDVINPATEEVAGQISMGSVSDVDRAALVARRAFASYSLTSVAERTDLFDAIVATYQERFDDIAEAITLEMGAPISISKQAQAALGLAHLKTALAVLKNYKFEELRGTTLIAKEPIGVCGLITPWNWPLNQIAAKVAPALATGCTMILKPSEIAPFSACVFAEILHSACVPAGVFNLVNGYGPTVGAAISSHPQIDMVSFTGSTRAGIEVAKNAAPTVKRVHQELGGKSPNIILDDADLKSAVAGGVHAVMMNSGQSCNAPTRMFVPIGRMTEAAGIARSAAESVSVGYPNDNVAMGPVVSQVQFDKIQSLIQKGIREGATLVTGGLGKPVGLEKGYYVKPTVFSDVTNDMTIAREEIFGPVLSIIGYRSEEEMINLANETEYGLAAYVQGEPEHARSVARQIRAGRVNINGAAPDFMAPFGGYKMSGNGREWGDHAFAEFLETKAVLGYSPF